MQSQPRLNIPDDLLPATDKPSGDGAEFRDGGHAFPADSAISTDCEGVSICSAGDRSIPPDSVAERSMIWRIGADRRTWFRPVIERFFRKLESQAENQTCDVENRPLENS